MRRTIHLCAALASGVLVLALGGCNTAGPGGPAVAAAAPALSGSWSGRLSGGAQVRIDVTPQGRVSYFFQGRLQQISAVRFEADSLRFRVGRFANPITLNSAGAYTYSERGQVTRATLTRT